MLRLSIQKTRGLFILFFFALAVPSGILSYKAHQQLNWQAMRQYQLEAQGLVEQIDSELQKAIEKEGARSDVDYTFFILAGTPEARLVQRSALAKFPVESDLPGVIGYFQVDDKGAFSSPILPSDYVQSAVHPQLYGISVAENKLRQTLQNNVADILSQNRLVVAKVSDTKQDNFPLESDEEKTDHLSAYLTDSSISNNASSEVVITASRLSKMKSGSDSSNNRRKLAETAIQNKLGFSQLALIERKRKKLMTKSTIEKREGKFLLEKKDEMGQISHLSKQKRNSRTEKNYSPQRPLGDEEKPNTLASVGPIQISLFESKIEPFKFSLLESGHFVMYRQVWQNGHRLFQGAVVAANDFIAGAIISKFGTSSLTDISDLRIVYAGETMQIFHVKSNAYSSETKSLAQPEILPSMNLSEPFSQFDLIFEMNSIPEGAGTSFINMLALSLLVVLVLGTYLLYRVTLKQSYLAQQQQDFVSSVSHELKTPLTSIRMYGEILKQGWVSDEKREEYYDYIYNESERLSRLIANILQISKVNHNALDLNLEDIEISEVTSLLKSKLDSQIEQSGFTLNISVDQQLDDRTLLIDKDAFVQIVINLVDNAIKYSKNTDKKQIDIKFGLMRNNKIQISVRDYGPGIAKTQINKVFELFYRSGDELTRTSTGTGIGLALVKELSVAMGAEVEAVNQSQGVVFSILFANSNR